ncbi:MAG: LPS assembly lipoprotein LptE, partial [Vicinamibacterales bacterium]|nr:LPS assembly lipoprotein LptE [Vicinamibacterales bacterium]
MRTVRAACVILVLAALSSSCGYSLLGRGSFLPSYIRVVGVPMFVNATPYFDIERLFTDKVRSEFIGRGRYQVLPQEEGVDAVLRGTITTMTVAPANFNSQQQASRYVFTVVMKIEFFDVRANKVLWENPAMSFREEYDLPPDASEGNVQAFFGQGA